MNQERGNQTLGLDNTLTRHVDRGTRDEPQYPLTEAEKERLKVNCWESCFGAYFKRVKESGLLGTDLYEDLPSEAKIFVDNILEKFDKKPYLGKIVDGSTGDVEGDSNPKTLEFYFEVYFSGVRVQLMAAEVRAEKKKKGHGPRAVSAEISFDEIQSDNVSLFKTASGEEVIKCLDKKTDVFKDFFHDQVVEKYRQSELEEKYKENYKELSREMIKFRKDMRRRFSHVYKEFDQKN